IYLIRSGGNDVSYALGGSGTGPFPTDSTAYLTSAANSLATSLKSLQDAGARTIIVEGQAESFPTNNATTRAAKQTYDTALFSGLNSQGVQYTKADINSVRLAIAANPSQY